MAALVLIAQKSPSARSVAGNACCVEFLSQDVDTTAASVRTTVSDSVHAEIETNLLAETDFAAFTGRRMPVCRIYLGALVRKDPSWNQIYMSLPVIQLPSWVEGIVWHMQSWCVCRRPISVTM